MGYDHIEEADAEEMEALEIPPDAGMVIPTPTKRTNTEMDDTRSKPTFFGTFDLTCRRTRFRRGYYSACGSAQEGSVLTRIRTFAGWKKSSTLPILEVRDAMITRSQWNVFERKRAASRRITAYVIETAHSVSPVIGEDKDEVLGILDARGSAQTRYPIPSSSTSKPSFVLPFSYLEGKSLNAL